MHAKQLTHAITIGEREYQIAWNARAARLLEKQTGKGIGSIITGIMAAFPNDNGGGGDLSEISIADLAALVWALINGVRDQEVAYQELEYDLDVPTMIALAKGALDWVAGEDGESPIKGIAAQLSATARSIGVEMSEPTGPDSGPSETGD